MVEVVVAGDLVALAVGIDLGEVAVPVAAAVGVEVQALEHYHSLVPDLVAACLGHQVDIVGRCR